jgi:hypothetical protein
MSTRGNRVWESLENWAARTFLLAGGLWLAALALELVGLALGTSMQEPSSIAGFTGAVLAFVALLGLYPRLAYRARRLAQVGVVLLLFPIAFSLLLLVWHIPLLFTSEIPSLLVYLPSPPLVYGALFFLSAVGITLFGVVGIRTGALAVRVGGLVLGVAAGWYLLLGAFAVYSPPIPDWVVMVQAAIFGVSLTGAGYLLRDEPEAADRAGETADAPA